MRWAPVAVASFALFAACRGSGDGVATDAGGGASVIDGALDVRPAAAAAGTGKKIGIVFTANVIGELEPCG